MRKAVIVDGVRTAFGKHGGTIRKIPMTDLAAIAIDGLLQKTQLLERGGQVDGVFMGSSLADCQSHAIARYATLKSRLGYKVWSSYVEKQCGSAIDSLNHAAAFIMCGMADSMIVGGAESHSNNTFRFFRNIDPYRETLPGPIMLKLAPTAEDSIDMITTADNVARLCGVSREACDEYAFSSQQRAAAATNKGFFKEEIIPIVIPATRKTPEICFDFDEFMKPNTTMDGLARLNSIYPNGVTTAGNASGKNDGAAMLLVMEEEYARRLGYQPYARFVAAGNCALDPKIMGLGPVGASLEALSRASLDIRDIDLWECNEAFAAQNLGVLHKLKEESGYAIPRDKWNVNGGAIAFGHPNGASGARITMFAMRELERRGAKYALATACCGGGQGVAAVIENLRL